MTFSVIDAFELKTIDVQLDKSETDKVPAHCHGDLGAYRMDSFLRRSGSRGPFSKIELWGIVLLSNGCMLPLCPVFKSLDNAANFIYGANLLCNSWARADREVYARHSEALLNLMDQYNGYPLCFLLEQTPGFKNNIEEPGARMNLNGYRPDAT